MVRDLVLGPKRFSDLRETLPRIPASMLSARLNELEQAGVVRRRVLPGLEATLVYELTDYGSELEVIVLQLGLWGARSLGEQAPDEVFTMDSAILSLYTTFRQEEAAGVQVNYELHYGDKILHAMVDDGALKVGEGSLPDADLVIEPTASMMPLLNGEISAQDAIRHGVVRVHGDPALLDLFTQMFHVARAPQREAGLMVH